MRKQLLITVASAALIAGMATASAQAPDKGGNADRGAPTKMQEAPKAAPSATPSPRASDPMDKAGAAPKAAQDTSKPADASKSAQDSTRPGMDKAGSAPKSAQDSSKSGADKAGMSKSAQDSKSGADRSAADKAAADSKSGAAKSAQDADKSKAGTAQSGSAGIQTTGQAGRTGAAVQINATQRTKIKQTINISSAPKVSNVNFSVSVGTRVPRDRVHPVPLPASIVEIVPEYRGYLYFVVEDRIVIVEPDTYEIVLIIT